VDKTEKKMKNKRKNQTSSDELYKSGLIFQTHNLLNYRPELIKKLNTHKLNIK